MSKLVLTSLLQGLVLRPRSRGRTPTKAHLIDDAAISDQWHGAPDYTYGDCVVARDVAVIQHACFDAPSLARHPPSTLSTRLPLQCRRLRYIHVTDVIGRAWAIPSCPSTLPALLLGRRPRPGQPRGQSNEEAGMFSSQIVSRASQLTFNSPASGFCFSTTILIKFIFEPTWDRPQPIRTPRPTLACRTYVSCTRLSILVTHNGRISLRRVAFSSQSLRRHPTLPPSRYRRYPPYELPARHGVEWTSSSCSIPCATLFLHEIPDLSMNTVDWKVEKVCSRSLGTFPVRAHVTRLICPTFSSARLGSRP